MHMGIGEEAICAGIIAHLGDGDSLALDHRGTPPILGAGEDICTFFPGRSFLDPRE
jgi:TPP-dependent pyruvate/acetoin dehydrogenase alpha subunit